MVILPSASVRDYALELRRNRFELADVRLSSVHFFLTFRCITSRARAT
jgi:hypothetical protein